MPFDLLLIGVFVFLGLVPRLFLIAFKSFEIFHSDHAVFGLMAKHVLEGHWMVYYYGQGYMGSLEAFVGALIFKCRGMNIVSVLLAPLVFYVLFLGVNYCLLKRLFGKEVGAFASLLLALSPPGLTLLSVTALGGYPETLFFGSLTLWALTHYRDSGKRPVFLFLSGWVAGIGYWVNNLILIYFLAIGLFGFLKSDFWKKFRPTLSWQTVFLLKGIRVPKFFRPVALVIQSILLLFIGWNLAAFFTGGPLTVGPLTIKFPSPPFLVKKVKKILLLLLAEIALIGSFALGIKKGWKALRPALPLIGGFLLGAAPVILHSLLGGEGYRVLHGSGTIFAKDLPNQFHAVVLEGFINGVLGVPIASFSAGGATSLFRAAALVISSGLFFLYAGGRRKECAAWIRLRPYPYPDSLFPLFWVV